MDRPTVAELKKFVSLNARLHTSRGAMAPFVRGGPMSKVTITHMTEWLDLLDRRRKALAELERRQNAQAAAH